MGGKMSRNKGANAEREVKAILASYGVETVRTPLSGGMHVKGDLTGWPGYHLEVKRVEKLDLPGAIRQAHEDCPTDCIPLVVHRRNKTKANGLMGEYFVTLKLEDFLNKLGYERTV